MDEPNRNKKLMPTWLWLLVIACVATDVFIIGKCAASMIAIVFLIFKDV